MVIINNFKCNVNFRYFWIKYVKGTDLSKCCAKSLIGEYSKFKYYKNIDFTLNEHEFEYLYICGVSTPYVYDNNLHIALKYKRGSDVVINEKGVSMTIRNTERIEIKEHKGHKFSYCRNWRFAKMINNE